MNREFLLQKTLGTMKMSLLDGNFVHCSGTWEYGTVVRPYNMFYFVVDGECVLEVSGEKRLLRKNQLALVPNGSPAKVSLTKNRNLYKYWCSFSTDIGGSDLFRIAKTKPIINVDNSEYVEDLFRKLLADNAYQNREANIIGKNANLSLLVAYYLEYSFIAKVQKNDLDGDLEGVAEYIKQHFQQDISVRELARSVHLSPEYFLRIFKKYFGCTPIQLALQLRMDMACNLLLQTDMTVAAVAQSVGIADVQYFIKVFKARNNGITPGSYKDKMGQSTDGCTTLQV